MLENVGGIMSTRGKPYIKVLTDTLSAIGYKIQLKKLTASDYGVPQDRKRVIIVGEMSLNGEGQFEYPEPLSTPKVTVRQAIADMMELEKYTLGSLKKAVFEGNVDEGSLMAGQVAGMVHEIKPVQQILQEMMDELKVAYQNLEI